MSSVRERSEIDDEYKWDLESIYATDEDWETAFVDVQERLGELEAYEGRVTESGDLLCEVLELRDELMREVSMVSSYARMRSDEDTRDQDYQAMATRARSLSAQAQSAASFIEPEILSLDPDEVDALVANTPGLETYEHYLDDVLRMRDHTRSAEVEELLSDLGEVLSAPNDVYSMLLNADMAFPTIDDPDGEPVEITQSNFTTLLKREHRPFRKRVHESFYGELKTVRNAVGASLKHSVKSHVKIARARRYVTAREAALDASNVPESVYDTLLSTVQDHLDALHRHVELKRRNLGVDELKMWDLYAPITGDENPTVTYEDAKAYVIEAVAPLGEDYQSQVADGLESRWVDVYENRGKKSGAYSGGTYDTQPFILMNWQDDVTSLFTLAHELGHSLHSELASEHQPYIYSDYEIFVAEVASTVNETLLTHHLLDTTEDDAFRRQVLDEYLERVRSTLFRQTMFAAFEHEIHTLSEAGKALTPDVLDSHYEDLKSDFYEPVAMDDHIAREWMRIPHFYYNYYVYQYATGISAAAAIVRRIRNEGEAAAEAYREALAMGGSAYPLEILDTAGVDMTSPEPIEDAIAEYTEFLDTLSQLS